MRIALLHTADVHVETFNTLFAQIGVEVELTHKVRADLLDRARSEGTEAVRNETLAELSELAAADAVICTCSTLGPVADMVAQSTPHVFRIDRPVMERACQTGPNIMVAICLDSTRDATLALLHDVAAEVRRTISPRLVLCQSAWLYFESGDMQGFATEIAETITRDLAEGAQADCIVLAQASMRVAQPYLEKLAIPVMSSPLLAAEHAIEIARRHHRGAL